MMQFEKTYNTYDTNWLNVIFKNSPIPIAIINNKLEVLNANDQFYELIGYSPLQVDTIKISNLIHSEDYFRDSNLFEKLFENNVNNINSTQRFIKKDNNIIWINTNITLNPVSNHNLPSYIAIFQDITKEKRANERIKKSEEKYRTLIENANDGIAIIDENINLILNNTAFYKTLGFSEKDFEAIEYKKLALFHPDDIPSIKKIFTEAIAGESIKIEKRLIDKAGNIRYFSLNIAPANHNNRPAIQLIQRETTDRVNEEKQNEEYRLFLETFMDNLPVPIYAKTVNEKRYMYWNKSIEDAMGICSDDIIGLSDSESCLPTNFIETSIDDEKKLINGTKRTKSEVEFINNRGEKRNYINIKSIFNPPTGSPLILGVYIDVSELRIAENIVEQSGYIIKEAQAIAKLGYWEYDIEKDLIFDNTENRVIFGISEIKHFFNLNNFLNLIHHSSKDEIAMNLERCIRKGESGEQVIVINIKNELKHILINFKPVKNKKGIINKIKGTAIDITRIKKSELAIQESKTKLRQAENIAKVGYWNINYENNTTELSGEVWNIMCLTHNTTNCTIESIIQNIHPLDVDNFKQYFNKEYTLPFEFTFRIIKPDGNIRFVKSEGTTVINNKKRPVRAIGLFQDVTNIKEKEIEIELLSTLLNEVQEITKTGYITQCSNDTITVSKTIYDILEQPDKLLNNVNDYNSYIHKEDKERVIKAIKLTKENGTKNNIQYRITLDNNKIKLVNEICYVEHLSKNTNTNVTRIITE